jgi:hypothetical protein
VLRCEGESVLACLRGRRLGGRILVGRRVWRWGSGCVLVGGRGFGRRGGHRCGCRIRGGGRRGLLLGGWCN